MPSDHDRDVEKLLQEAYQAIPEPAPTFRAALQARLANECAKTAVAANTLRPSSWFAWRRWAPPVNAVLVVAAVLLALTATYLWFGRDQARDASEHAQHDIQALLAVLDQPQADRQTWSQAVAKACRQLLEAPGPASAEHRARILVRLAACEKDLGERDQAREHYRQAVPLWEGLCRDQPGQAGHRRALADSYHQLGILQREIGQTALADRAFEQALEIYGRVEPAPDRSVEHAIKVGDLCSDRAFALAAAGNLNGALDWYDRAIQTLEAVPPAQLQARDAWRVLFLALAGRSQALTAQGRQTESLQDWERALELANRSARDSQRIIGPPGKPLIWGADVEGGAPYLFEDPKDRNNLIGFEMDLAKALARVMGRPLQFKQHSWPKLFDGLDQGDFDIAMNGLEVMPHRLERYRFSRPYYVYQLQLVVRAGEPRFRSLQECRAHKDTVIGVLANTAAEWHLDRLGIKRKSYPAQLESYSDLLQGRIDGVLCDTPGAGYYVKQYPKLSLAGAPIAPGFYAIAVNPRNEALLSEINVALERLLQTGELRRIYEKWNLWNADQEGLFNLQGIPQELGGPAARRAES